MVQWWSDLLECWSTVSWCSVGVISWSVGVLCHGAVLE